MTDDAAMSSNEREHLTPPADRRKRYLVTRSCTQSILIDADDEDAAIAEAMESENRDWEINNCDDYEAEER